MLNKWIIMMMIIITTTATIIIIIIIIIIKEKRTWVCHSKFSNSQIIILERMIRCNSVKKKCWYIQRFLQQPSYGFSKSTFSRRKYLWHEFCEGVLFSPKYTIWYHWKSSAQPANRTPGKIKYYFLLWIWF